MEDQEFPHLIPQVFTFLFSCCVLHLVLTLHYRVYLLMISILWVHRKDQFMTAKPNKAISILSSSQLCYSWWLICLSFLEVSVQGTQSPQALCPCSQILSLYLCWIPSNRGWFHSWGRCWLAVGGVFDVSIAQHIRLGSWNIHISLLTKGKIYRHYWIGQ